MRKVLCIYVSSSSVNPDDVPPGAPPLCAFSYFVVAMFATWAKFCVISAAVWEVPELPPELSKRLLDDFILLSYLLELSPLKVALNFLLLFRLNASLLS